MYFSTRLLAGAITLLLLANPLCAANDPTAPEDMENPVIRGAVNMYRDYMSCATIASLQSLRVNEVNEAATFQNYLLFEIVAEMESSLEIYSHPQRKSTLELFKTIESYYQKHPWSNQAWNQEVASDKKQSFTKIDSLRRLAIAKDWSTVPEGSLKDSVHMPALIAYRSFMADTAIELLKKFESDDTLSAEKQLEIALDELLAVQVEQAERLSSEWVDQEAETMVLHTLFRIDTHYTEFPRAYNVEGTQLAELDQRLKKALNGYRYMGGMVYFGIK